MSKFYVRVYTERGGMLASGEWFATADEAVAHITRVLDTNPSLRGGEVWANREVIATFTAERHAAV
jgi:hypothetical protein